MNKEEAIRIAQGLITDFKCESDTMVDFCNTVIKALKQEPCEDVISRTAVLNTLDTMDKALDENRTVEEYKELLRECYEQLPSISTEKTSTYKQGWHDAIITALKETHSVHTEEGNFRVVQEETLMGVGMAMEVEK